MIKNFASALVIFALSACRTTAPSTNSQLASTSDEAPIKCPAGFEELRYSLAALEGRKKVDPKKLKFEDPPRVELRPMNVDITQGSFLRLDMCYDSANNILNLQRVVYSPGAPSIGYTGLIKATDKTTGLSDAILAGEYNNLDMLLPIDDQFIMVRAFDNGDGWIVGVARGTMINGKFKGYSLNVLTGTFVYGDVLANRKCQSGKSFHQSKFQINTAKFEFDSCQGLGGGETTSYDIVKLTVKDDNPAIPAANRSLVFEGSAKVKEVMNYLWNHHNACDSFYLKLPNAEYAATTTPSAGCGNPVANAPARKMMDDPNMNKVMYRVRYGAGEWKDGLLNCPHYVFNCKNTFRE